MPEVGKPGLPQLVILAGGKGTRLRALAGDLPKALMPVAGRPFIDHQLSLLADRGAHRILLCLGVGAEQIESHVGHGSQWGLHVDYVHESADNLAGTGGALTQALPALEDEFGVLYGDSYLPINYRAAYEAFTSSQAKALMTVYKNQGRWDKSNTRIDGNRVSFYSKSAPPGTADYIDYGLSYYRRTVIEKYRDYATPFDLSIILSDLVASNDLAAFEVNERFYEIGQPEGWAELDALLTTS